MPRSGHLCVRTACSVSVSFNEAGAIMPRSGLHGIAHTVERAIASMRPGQSCPGVVSALRETDAPHLLLQ